MTDIEALCARLRELEGKWTPGEWLVDTHEKSGTLYIIGKRKSGDTNSYGDGWLAEINAATSTDERMFPERYPEDESNAALIALAPQMAAALTTLHGECERLRAALNEIKTSKFCNYENTSADSYGTGVTDGHRYCSNVAAKALSAPPHGPRGDEG